MPIVNTALAHLIIIALIGIVCGLVFSRYGQVWFGRNVTGTRHTDFTTF